VIRTAAPEDDALVRELWRAFDAEVPDAPWRPADEDPARSDLVLLADEDGIAALTRLGERAWFLDLLYVRPRSRNRGLGRELLRAAAEQARDAGAEMLELEVLESNEGARRLYERLGFVTVERTLAAPLERLAGGHAEGPTYGRVHVQTDDVDAVRANVAKVLPRLGRNHEHEVAPAGDWVRVRAALADEDPAKLQALAKELSYTSGGVSLALGVERGSVVRYTLYDRGSMVDEYASVPEYYGPLPPGDVIALGANPTVVARLTGADPHRVREVARTAGSPADLPPADELYRQIADLLRVEVD
jgi:GNAT superfamily N-acetyltransferase